MRPLLIGLLLVVGLAPLPGRAQAPQGPVSPKVSVTFEPNGLVSLAASEASIREILAEWSRKGGTQFKGVDTLTGSGMTVQYEHRPEIEVINSLLRNVAGIVVGPRDQVASIGPGASNIGIVFVLPTSNPSTGGYSTPAYSAPQSPYSTPGSPDTEIPPAGPGRAGDIGPAIPAPTPTPQNSSTSGVRPVAVQVVPVPSAGSTPPPATPPATTTGGRGGDGRGGRGSR